MLLTSIHKVMNFEMENILYISDVIYSFQNNPFPNIGKNRSVIWKYFKQDEKLDYYFFNTLLAESAEVDYF